MEYLPYKLTSPIGTTGVLGLTVLQTDETIEQEFKILFSSPTIAVYVTRIRMQPNVNEENLVAMENDISLSVQLFPPLEFSVIAFCCTSASVLIGPEKISKKIGKAALTKNVTDPYTAVVAALRALQVNRIAVVTPYIGAISTKLSESLAADGYVVHSLSSFNESLDEKIAHIDPQSILDAVIKVGSDPCVDAVFVSCTNCRTVGIIASAETALAKPVFSSNTALAWHMCELAGLSQIDACFGSLFSHHL